MQKTTKIFTLLTIAGSLFFGACSFTDKTPETPLNTQEITQEQNTETETATVETEEKPATTAPKKQQIKPEKTENKPAEEQKNEEELTDESTKEIDDLINSIIGE